MLESNDDKPKISRPKPTIASKPKYIPPVNLKVTPKCDNPLIRANNGKDAFLEQQKPPPNSYAKTIDYGDKYSTENKERTSVDNVKFIPQHQSYKTGHDVGSSDVRDRAKNGHERDHPIKINEIITKKTEKLKSVAPNSPSTVCCSILSNSAGDCCGIMGNKKEFTSSTNKNMIKIDSLDSNSSDSGGFKDFIQLDTIKKVPLDAENEKKPDSGHQRKFSQPDFLEKSVFERAKSLNQSFCERKLSFSGENVSDEIRKPKTEIGRLAPNLVQNLAPTFNANDKTDDTCSKIKQKPQIISHGQFKQSTKMLEEILAQRLEKEKQRQKKLGSSYSVDGDSSSQQQYEQQMAVQKQFQQKLQADLLQTVKQIQEIQSIELRLPQNRKLESNRSQPAIGLKHTPKSRELKDDLYIEG